jgi:RNA polymerase sigma factor (sigma-70 family)
MMAKAMLGGFLQQLRKTMAAETLASDPDGELIGRFLASHDEGSFQALMHRHGPMVLRVCRRALPDEQDIEDAFQATFLVLAREADAIRKRASLASWLHGVAHRVALDARKAGVRRRKHEAQAATRTGSVSLPDEVGWKELRCVLDEELVRLPDRLRAPLVLCYLEGLTQDEAAARLGQSKSTFRRNLERGRERLGVRLTRRGVTLSAALFALLLSECAASAAVPPALAASTTGAAVALAAGKAVAALASARALALARGLAHPVLSAKVKAVCVLLVAGALAGFGGYAVQHDNAPLDPTPSAERQEAAKATTIDPPAAKVVEPKPAQRIEFRNPLLVLHAEVQKELKLTEEQVRKVRAVDDRANEDASRVNPPPPGAPGSRVNPLQPGAPAEPGNKRNVEKVEALRETLPEILTDAQAVRLRQLEKQVAGMSAFLDPEYVKLLKLTDEQQGKVQAIIAQAHQVPLQQHPGRVGDFDSRQADKAAIQQILELLTEDQRRTWRDLTGDAIDIGSLRLSEPSAGLGSDAGPGLPPGAAVPVADPGLDLVIAAGLVAVKSLQEDLKLTADQVKADDRRFRLPRRGGRERTEADRGASQKHQGRRTSSVNRSSTRCSSKRVRVCHGTREPRPANLAFPPRDLQTGRATVIPFWSSATPRAGWDGNGPSTTATAT